jgi:ribosomal protein S18 acetylase RimI-like enzyme
MIENLVREVSQIMIVYNTDKKVDYDRLIILFNQVGWNDKTDDIDRLKAMVENSQIIITAWDEEIMIGFARCTTDYVFNGQINNVVVDLKYRRVGIGKALISKILDSNKQVTYILRGSIRNEEFYRSLGFEDGPISLVYKRKK